MRYLSARNCLLAAVLATPALLRAQFQPPTAEELRMTADPKAPGAAAVYLNFTEDANDMVHYQSFYARIKVLSEKGTELATVTLPYARGNRKITNIEGRTIHADGTIVPFTARPEDLLVSKRPGLEFGHMVFTLPSVEVGSILEYRYQIRYDDKAYTTPLWQIQRDYFVHKAHFSFTPFKAFLKGSDNATSSYLIDEHGYTIHSLLWWSVLPPGAQVKTDASGRFSLDVTDIPAAPDEAWMPPTESVLYKVVFYYISEFSTTDFWETETKQWSKQVDQFAEPTKPIRDAVAGLIAPGDTDLDKAKKLYKAVQALDNTDFSRRKGEAELKVLGLRAQRRAEDTWAQKSGSRDDIALLYLAMLRAAGLNAYAMRVVDRDRGTFAIGYFNFDQLDDDIVLVTLNGKDVALDPGEKMCPFLNLSWKHSGAGGVRQSAEGRVAATSPQQVFSANTLERAGDIQWTSTAWSPAMCTSSWQARRRCAGVSLHWRTISTR